MSAVQFPPLVCKSCNGAGRLDVGTEDEGPCGADHCHCGVLVCVTCNDRDGGDDEPAVGTVFRWGANGCDEVIPLCRTHMRQAHAAQAREDHGDYLRDMRKHGDW